MSSIKQEKIREHYDTIADTYDHHYDHPRGRNYHSHISNYLIRALPPGGNFSISDAGQACLSRSISGTGAVPRDSTSAQR